MGEQAARSTSAYLARRDRRRAATQVQADAVRIVLALALSDLTEQTAIRLGAWPVFVDDGDALVAELFDGAGRCIGSVVRGLR